MREHLIREKTVYSATEGKGRRRQKESRGEGDRREKIQMRGNFVIIQYMLSTNYKVSYID